MVIYFRVCVWPDIKLVSFQLTFTGDEEKATVIRHFQCRVPSCTSVMNLTLWLSPCYPHVCPRISLSGKNLSSEVLNVVKDLVERHAQSLIGQPMMLDLIMYVQETISSAVHADKICTLCSKSANAKEDVEVSAGKAQTGECSLSMALLQIDHMRAKSSYVKTINSWTGELALNGFLLFYDWIILLLLQGDLKDIQNFIFRLRTVNIDVDSHGRSCKERMAKVLAQMQCLDASKNERFAAFSVIELATWEGVEELFHKHCLDRLFMDHVKCLRKR